MRESRSAHDLLTDCYEYGIFTVFCYDAIKEKKAINSGINIKPTKQILLIFSGLGYSIFGNTLFSSLTNPTHQEIAFFVNKLRAEYKEKLPNEDILSIVNNQSKYQPHIADSATGIAMLNLKGKISSFSDEDWKQIANLINQSSTSETEITNEQVKELLTKICNNTIFNNPPGDSTFVDAILPYNSGIYRKFTGEKEQCFVDAIQTVLSNREEYIMKLSMKQHNDYPLPTQNPIASIISSSICDEKVFPLYYLVDFAEALKTVVEKEAREEENDYHARIAKLAYRSLNDIPIADQTTFKKDATQFNVLCQKYKDLKKEYIKIQNEWHSASRWQSFYCKFCCTSQPYQDKDYQNKLLELFLKHTHTLPQDESLVDMSFIEDFINSTKENDTVITELFAQFITSQKAQDLTVNQLISACKICKYFKKDQNDLLEKFTDKIKNSTPEEFVKLLKFSSNHDSKILLLQQYPEKINALEVDNLIKLFKSCSPKNIEYLLQLFAEQDKTTILPECIQYTPEQPREQNTPLNIAFNNFLATRDLTQLSKKQHYDLNIIKKKLDIFLAKQDLTTPSGREKPTLCRLKQITPLTPENKEAMPEPEDELPLPCLTGPSIEPVKNSNSREI